jgi:glycosyltransferase involved in cell wall biosynthesis
MMSQVVIYMGVLTEYQGIDILLEAIPLVVREAPNVKFLIVGYPNEDYYRQKARTLGVATWVHFTGKVPHEELPRYLSLADVAVSPKISTTEANLKLFSYLAMGLPTVVFDNPVNREILGDLGIYATAGDAKSLAQALVGILQDRFRARQLGAQGRAKATSDYSWLAVGKRLKHIYDAVEKSSVSKQDGGPKEKNNDRIEDPGDRRSRFYGLPFNKRAH